MCKKTMHLNQKKLEKFEFLPFKFSQKSEGLKLDFKKLFCLKILISIYHRCPMPSSEFLTLLHTEQCLVRTLLMLMLQR